MFGSLYLNRLPRPHFSKNSNFLAMQCYDNVLCTNCWNFKLNLTFCHKNSKNIEQIIITLNTSVKVKVLLKKWSIKFSWISRNPCGALLGGSDEINIFSHFDNILTFGNLTSKLKRSIGGRTSCRCTKEYI
jgi:hypothetical protein